MSPIKKSGHNLKLTRLLSANAVAFTEQSCLSKNLKRQKIDIVLFRLPIPTKTFVSFRLLSLTKVSLIASPQQQCVTALLLSAVVELFFPRVLLPVLHEFPKKNTRKGCFFVNGGEAEIDALRLSLRRRKCGDTSVSPAPPCRTLFSQSSSPCSP